MAASGCSLLSGGFWRIVGTCPGPVPGHVPKEQVGRRERGRREARRTVCDRGIRRGAAVPTRSGRPAAGAPAPGHERASALPDAERRRDLVAGVTVAALAIPSAMAYSEVAGLSPINGLYAVLLPVVAYVLLGSSKQLVIGPEGSTSTLVGAAILPLAVAGGGAAAQLAAMLALLVALCFALAWALRLGWIADSFSRPVLIGYIHCVAVIRVIGQLGRPGSARRSAPRRRRRRGSSSTRRRCRTPTRRVSRRSGSSCATCAARASRWSSPGCTRRSTRSSSRPAWSRRSARSVSIRPSAQPSPVVRRAGAGARRPSRVSLRASGPTARDEPASRRRVALLRDDVAGRGDRRVRARR